MEVVGPVFVEARPAVTPGDKRGAELVKEWTTAIAKGLGSVWKEGYHLTQPCQIDLKFFLEPSRVKDSDLDNLLKPCIDAIARVIFRGELRRNNQYVAEDFWIYRLTAEKAAAADMSSVGVEITIRTYGD